MQKITPNLWFDGNAKEAVDFYTAAFANSKIGETAYYPNEGLLDFQQALAGKELTIDFELDGQNFAAINAGPEFKFNPSLSFMVNFDPARDAQARDKLTALWGTLSDGGEALMPLSEYPFSELYGWVKDRYGLTWQLILTNPDGEPRPAIIPAFMFGGAKFKRAEEAIDFYKSVFRETHDGTMAKYTEAMDPARAGAVMFADFMLENQWFVAMDSDDRQDFSFNEAVSLVVACKDQAEIDYYWQKLSTVPEAEQCGWCKDQFGVSWQIVPDNIAELMAKPHAFGTLMDMKKISIAGFDD